MFIRRCVICEKILGPSDKYLCPTCKKYIKKDFFDNYLIRCPNCYQFLINKKIECKYCQNKVFKNFSMCDYNSDTRFVLFALKFGGKKSLAPMIASLYEEQLQKLSKGDKIALIPITGSKYGNQRRGFDHMPLICEHINYNTFNVLIRKDDNQQKYLDKVEREKNYTKRFAINLKELQNIKEKVIFLVDDIYTTGFTMKSAYELLKKHTNKEIKGITWFSSPSF